MHRSWNHPARWIVLALFSGLTTALLAGCNSSREKMPAESASAPAEANSVKVTVQPVTFRPVQRMVGWSAHCTVTRRSRWGAKVAGRVRKISRRVADRVKPGELLPRLNPPTISSMCAQAKSLQVEFAKLGLSELPGSKVVDVTRIPTVVQAR